MNDARASTARLTVLGAILLILGLMGHLLAARAIGGSYIAYRDHTFGFFIGLIVFGAVAAGLGSRFWKRRPDITLLVVGVAQALFGLVVYIERFHIG